MLLRDTVTVSVSAMRSSLSAENTTYAVISFVSDAGSRRADGSNAASRVPLVASTRTQARAANMGAGCAIARSTMPNRYEQTEKRQGASGLLGTWLDGN